MTDAVRRGAARVMSRPRHVRISQDGIRDLVAGIDVAELGELVRRKHIDQSIHFVGDDALTAQYLLVLDAINFCFWPDSELAYQHLSTGLKTALQRDKALLDAERLKKIQGAEIRAWLEWKRPLPLEEERARLLREVGEGLDAFGGKAQNFIKAAQKSAAKLLSLLTAHFPGFRDHAVYRGEQIFLLKRAQIFVGDVWGSFGGKGLGEFHDIEVITTFPDYKVPQLLHHLNVLQYTPQLTAQIEEKMKIESGSSMEVEIRAATVEAVEQMRSTIRDLYGPELTPLSIQLDWWLWERVEDMQLPFPHHQTWTMFY